MGNNPIRYVDPDGMMIWASTMWWLPAVDGPFPVGDVLYGLGVTVELIGFSNTQKKSVIEYSITQSRSLESTKGKNKPNVLYRAVNQKELDSIIACKGRFSMGDESTYESGKLFQTELADVMNYVVLANSSIAADDPYVAVVSTSDTFNSAMPINTIIDAPSAVIVPTNRLGSLTPAIIILEL